MRILIFSLAAGTPEVGPNMRTFYLGRQLVERGHEVVIVGSGYFHKYKRSPLVSGQYTTKVVSGITYHWLRTFRYKKRNYQQVLNQIDFAFRLWVHRKKWINFQPDVVLISSPPPFGIYVGRSIANRCNAKLIFELRDLWPEIISELGNFGESHPYLLLVKHAVKTAYKSADGVVSVKPGDLAFVNTHYQVKGKTAYIPNGFDHRYVLDEEFQHPALDRNTFKVIYTGALSSYYAMEYLFFAAEQLKSTHPDIEILIAGEGADKENYEKLKADKKLTNVTFLGFLPKKYMLSLIRKGDIAFLGLRDTKANRLGISTNKLYEYMYARTPIVASYRTDYDVVSSANCGITVPPESAEHIYDAITTLYSMDVNQRIQLGQNGYEFLISNHTFDEITESYLKFINSLD